MGSPSPADFCLRWSNGFAKEKGEKLQIKGRLDKDGCWPPFRYVYPNGIYLVFNLGILGDYIM